MINTIAEISATVIDVLFCLWFIPRFNKKKIKSKPWTISFVALLLVYQLIADRVLADNYIVYAAGAFMIALAFSLFLEPKKPLWSILAAILYQVIIMLGAMLAIAIISFFISDIDEILQNAPGSIRVIHLGIVKIVQFILFRLVLFIFRKDQTIDIWNALSSFLFTGLTAVGLGALFKMMVDYKTTENNPYTLILALILIFVNIIFYLMIRQVQKLTKDKYELRLLEERTNAEKARMEEAHVIWEKIRKTRHDLKNHFTVMYAQLEEGQTEECKAYMDGLYHTIESMGDLIRSGNSVIDYLINTKLSNLDGVQVLVSGYVGNYRDIEDMDLVAIIGNILDNAVEAQQTLEGTKRIELMFLQKNANRIIICKNTVKESVLKTNKALKSTKKAGDAHGLGHQIVESAVQKYGGWVDYFEAGDMFGVEVVLPDRTEQDH